MRTLLVCLCLASCLATTAVAQRSTPSHRLIRRPPGSGTPKLSDFGFSREDQEVLEALQNREQARTTNGIERFKRQGEAETKGQGRASGQQARPSTRRSTWDHEEVVEPPSTRERQDPQTLPRRASPNSEQRDGDVRSPVTNGNIEQPSEEEQRTIRNLQREIQKTFEKMRDEQGLGEELSKTLDSDALKDQEAPLVTPKAERKLRDFLEQEKKKAEERLANRARRNPWSKDELLKKVEPFINAELVKQILKDRAEQEAANRSDSKNSGAQNATGNPTPSNSKGSATAATKSKSNKKGLLDSLMSSIDKQGTEWLKSSSKSKTAKEKKKKKKTSTWLTALKAKAKQRMSNLNQQIAQQSQKVNSNRSSKSKTAKAPAVMPTRSGGSNDGGSSDGGASSQILLWILAALGLAGVGYYFWQRHNEDPESARVLDKQIRTITIQDRESLLRACNQLAWRCFGWPSRFWNHRTVFTKLSELAKDHQVADQLSGLYEQARYAPNRRFSRQEVELARELFSTIRSRSLATQ